MTDIKELIESCIEMNSDRREYGEERKHNILIHDLKTYTRIKQELSSHYKIIELDALDIIFYRLTTARGGEYCAVDHGPGTEKNVVRTSDFASCCNIEKPVISYHSGAVTYEMNRFLQTLFETETALVVIKNIDKISNPANRHVLVRFLWNLENSPVLPVIVLLENVDKRIYAEIISDSKDTLISLD